MQKLGTMAVFVRIQQVDHLGPAHARIHTFQGHVVPRTKRVGPHKFENWPRLSLCSSFGMFLSSTRFPNASHTLPVARERAMYCSANEAVSIFWDVFKFVLSKRILWRQTMTLKLNDFQHGIEEVRDRVASLIGERLTGDKDDMFTGCWAGPQQCRIWR